MKFLVLIYALSVVFHCYSPAQSTFNSAVDFDGDGDYASTVNEPVFPTGNGTIEAWIKVNNITSENMQSVGDAFFTKNEEQWNEGDFYMFVESATGKLKARIQSPPSQPPMEADIESNKSFWNHFGSWYHIAFSWGIQGMKMYVGTQKQIDENLITNSALTNNYNFYIGAEGYKLHNGNYVVGNYFNGQIDEVRIWNHQRTEEQLDALWGAPLDSSYYSSIDSGLVGYWKFDELEDLGINNDGADDVRDFSVLHNHLDLSGDAHLVPANIVVPVELTSFSVKINSDGFAELDWETATEVNNLGFEVQKSFDRNEFFTIGFVNGTGTTTEPQEYNFIDENISNAIIYYRLKQIDYNGSFEYSIVLEISVNLFKDYNLYQNYPNPFNPSTKIKYTIPTFSKVLSPQQGNGGLTTLKVYDVLGNEVATLVNEEKPAGEYEVEFEGTGLPSGVYLYKLNAGNSVQTKKMLLIK